LRRCQRDEEAKTILDKSAEPTKCLRRFNDTFNKLDAKATAAAIACRYRDNGDNTVTDFQTGLMWVFIASESTTNGGSSSAGPPQARPM
jgi:hypothetical protein